MLKEILRPIVSLGGMSLLFGTGLAFASKKFAVKTDPREQKILDVLPEANCGACGYPGCAGYASAVVQGKASVTACPVGGTALSEQICKILKVEMGEVNKQVAKVLCSGDCDSAVQKYHYEGIKDCGAAIMLASGPKGCSYGCLGLGSCVRACLFDAIHINEKGIAQVDRDKCTGCKRCIDACPKDIIHMIPEASKVQVMCVSQDKARDVRKVCKAGCIGCRLCVRACEYDAIKVENNVAKIDYEKCVNCMACAEKCPTKAIHADFETQKVKVKSEVV